MDDMLDYLPKPKAPEFKYQARIAICAPRKVKGYKQHAMSAVMIVMDKNQPDITDIGNWENIQCEIIIRPIMSLGEAKIKNMRLDHAALALSDDSQWERVKPKKK